MGKTRLYGLIGYPVKHSYSPSIHNAAFKKLKLDATYRLFEVRPQDLEAFIKNLPGRVSGCNVTIPHKENVIKHLDKVTRRARLIGAVNTIVVKGGKLCGDNTDGRGFVKAFKLNTSKAPKGKRIFIFGAGGGAKAVAFEMALSGARSITVCDPLAPRARNLILRINRNTKCAARAVSPKDKKKLAVAISASDVLINATPCGMKKGDPRLLDAKLLHEGLIVCDLIYNPSATPLIRAASSRGLRVMNGMGMLLYQGVISFKIWTGKNAPVSVMKQTLEARMADAG